MFITSWRGSVVAGVAAIAALAITAGCAPPVSCPSDFAVLASFPATDVDPAITLPNSTSFAAIPATTPRNRLVVLLSGSGTGPTALSPVAKSLAADGYHVLGVSYDSTVPTLTACPDNVAVSDPDCHRRFRGEVAFGSGVADPSGASYDHAGLDVPIANSAVNGLMKQLDYVRTQYPLGGWEQFQNVDNGSCVTFSTTYGVCEPRWSSTVVMGFSQGAGLALYLSKFFAVDRVGLLSGPFDAFRRGSNPPLVAGWISEGGFATPSSQTVALSHVDDPNLFRYRAVADSLGLAGPEVRVTQTDRPFGGAQRLLTDIEPYAPTNDPRIDAHNAPAKNSCPRPTVHADVWRYQASGQ